MPQHFDFVQFSSKNQKHQELLASASHFTYKQPTSTTKMASEMTVIHHPYKGLLKFVLSEDTMTVDIKVMTLKGIHIFWQDKHSNEKSSFLGVNTITLYHPF